MSEFAHWLGVGGLAGALVALGHFLPKLAAFLRSGSADSRKNARAGERERERDSDRAVAMYRELVQGLRAREAERDGYVERLLEERIADRVRIAALETENRHLKRRD